jgi:hypothetical protein
VKFKYTLSLEEIVDAVMSLQTQPEVLKPVVRKKQFLYLLLMSIFSLLIWMINPEKAWLALFLMGVSLVAVFFFNSLYTRMLRRVFKKQYSVPTVLDGVKDMECSITKSEISLKGLWSEGKYDWEAVEKMVEGQLCYAVQFKSKSFMALPKRLLKTAKMREQFLSYFASID